MLSINKNQKCFAVLFFVSIFFMISAPSGARTFTDSGFDADLRLNVVPEPEPIQPIHLEGVVTDDLGAPAANIPVSFILDDKLGFETTVLTDVNGNFSIQGFTSKYPVDGLVHAGCTQDIEVDFKSGLIVDQDLYYTDCFNNLEPGFASAN